MPQGKHCADDVAPTVVEYLPAAQGVHDAAPAKEYVPVGQLTHEAEPGVEYVPAAHDVHE